MLDQSVNKATFRAAVILIVAGVLSLFFPLDAPAGSYADRMLWFSSNLSAFVTGWLVQIIAMLSLAGVFAGVTWHVREASPIAAFIAGVAVLLSVAAFLVTKFTALWAFPQMVAAAATVSADSAIAELIMQIMHPTVTFSMFSTFDYLGFWMYAVFALLVARPLLQLSVSAKVAAVGLGLFGVLYHLLIIGVMYGSVATADIVPYVELLGLLLFIAVISLAVYFRHQSKPVGEE